MTVTIVNERDSLLQAAVTRDSDPQANKYILLTPSTPIFHVAANGVATPPEISLRASMINIGGGTLAFSTTNGTLTGTGNTRTLAFSDMTVDNVTITVTVTDLGQTYTATQVISKVADGASGAKGETGSEGAKYATAYLYKWSTVTPGLPAGTSTLSWNVGANTSYVGADGWSITVPTNPGTTGVQLWVANKPITAASATSTTDVTYSVGATVAAVSMNGVKGDTGVPGVKNAVARAYQWSTGAAPTATGSATYTWATADYNTVPSGWTKAKTDSPALGYTLYEASVALVDSAGSATSTVDWTTASRAGIGYSATNGTSGTSGNSAAIAYTLVTGSTLNSTPTSSVTTGTAKPNLGTWGETVAWTDQPSVPVAGQSVFQSNGIYNTVSAQTTWGRPYLSNLRVGSLSAISVDLGTITAGAISIGAGNFAVDVSGNSIMKSILIKDSIGNTILSSSATNQVTTANAGTFIQNGAIGNTQIGGDIQSTNWNGNTGTSGAGWLLQRSGNLHANSVSLRGAVMGGSYAAYAWPATGLTGFYLGPEGLLLGNGNDNRHFQVTSNGNVYAPSFSIVNGNASFSGTLAAGAVSTSSLASLNANLGAITAGSLNINNKFIVAADGATTIQSAAAGQRTVITSGLIEVYDSNRLRVRMGVW